MSMKNYRFGKGKSATKAVHADLPGGQHHAVGIGNMRVFIIPDGKFWFAQGLEIDYAAQGDSAEQAKQNFEEGLALTIDLHLRMDNNIEKLLKPAPPEVLQEAVRSMDCIKLFWQVSVHEIAKADEPLPFGGIDYYLVQKAAA